MSDKTGNTIGVVVGHTPCTPVPASMANPPLEESGRDWLDNVQTGLDVVGLAPVVGEIADGVNGLISLARGDYVGAGLSFAAMVPFAGWGATVGKGAWKVAQHTAKETAERATKQAAKETATKSAKELEQKAAKESNPGGDTQVLARSKLSHINGSIAELRAHQKAIDDLGHVSIKEPGKVTASGPDFITFNPKNKSIVVWDAKYRGPGGSFPTAVPADKLNSWMPQVREAVQNMPPGTARDAAMGALRNGKVGGKIAPWPK